MMDLQIVTCSYISVLLKNIGKMHYQIYVYSKRKGPLSQHKNTKLLGSCQSPKIGLLFEFFDNNESWSGDILKNPCVVLLPNFS